MNNKRKMLVAGFAIVTFATPAFAWMGNYGMGYGGGPATARATLSAEQQKQVDAVQGKYQPKLDELQQKLGAKSSELAAARANGSTTVSQLNALETELFQLERQYWTLLDQANQEMFQVGGGHGPSFACDYRGCDHSYGRHGMMMDNRSMPAGRYGSCCW